jgi:hypothetical protein
MKTPTSRPRERSESDDAPDLVWPPPADSHTEPVVFDLHKFEKLSVDQAAALGAEPVQRPERVSKLRPLPPPPAELPPPAGETTPRWYQNRKSWPRPSSRVLVTALVVIVAVQTVALGLFLTRDRTADASRQPATGEPARVATPPAFVPPASAPSLPLPEPARPVETAKLDTGVTATSGRLLVRTSPDGAVVLVDGRRRGTTPLTLDGLAPGSHRVEIQNGGASIRHDVNIEAGGTASVLVPLAESGWLDLRSSVELQIFESGKPLGTTSDGPLGLKAGAHSLVLRNDELGYSGTADVTVVAGEMARVRQVLPDGVLQVNAQPWATVSIDGREVGDTPLGNLRVPLGPHEIRFQHPNLGQQTRQVVISARTPARVSVDLR